MFVMIASCFYDDNNYIFNDPLQTQALKYYSKSSVETAYKGLFSQAIVIESGIPPIPSDTIKIQTLISKIAELENLYVGFDAIQYGGAAYTPPTGVKLAAGVTNFLRAPKYNSATWTISLGASIDENFINYIKDKNLTLYNELYLVTFNDDTLLTDGYGGLIDFGHLAATTKRYCGAHSTLVPDFWTGWGGDLATGMSDTATAYNKRDSGTDYSVYLGKTIQEIADMIIGNETSSCNYSDLCTDIDAYKIAKYIKENGQSSFNPLSEALTWYYTNCANIRFNFYPDDIGCEKALDDLGSKLDSRMHGTFEKLPDGLLSQKARSSTPEMQLACCKSLAKFIFKRMIF